MQEKPKNPLEPALLAIERRARRELGMVPTYELVGPNTTDLLFIAYHLSRGRDLGLRFQVESGRIVIIDLSVLPTRATRWIYQTYLHQAQPQNIQPPGPTHHGDRTNILLGKEQTPRLLAQRSSLTGPKRGSL